MKTCEDCVHYKLCNDSDLNGGDINVTEQCEYFKDKSKFIELPCRIGDYIEWRNEWGDIVFLEVTGFDFDEKGNAVKYHTKFSDIQPSIDDEDVLMITHKRNLMNS
jgi:hypothetical protein